MTIRAAAFAAALTIVATPAFAQHGWRGDYYGSGRYYDNGPAPYDDLRPYYGSRGYEGPRPYGRVLDGELGLSRREVVAILRAANLEPASPAWRAGSHVMVRATNARGEVVRVAIDAYRGRIAAVGPADGTMPSARLAPDAPGNDAAPDQGVPPASPPRVITAPRANAPDGHNAAVTPPRTPMPRPRPPETTASIKPPEAAPAAPPAAGPAAAPTPAPATETAPAETPRKDTPAPAPDTGFPPVAPLD